MLAHLFYNPLSSKMAMKLNLKNINRLTVMRLVRLQHQLVETQNEEPIYPPIIDPSEEGQNRHQRQIWYDSIKAMPTVEEKLHELSAMQKIRSTKYIITDVPSVYTGVYFQNFITRTHLIKDLPDRIKLMQVDKELSEIKDTLNNVLQNYYCNSWKNGSVKSLSDYLDEDEAGSSLAKGLVAQCFKNLAPKNEYIMNSTIQHQPRIDSYWWHYGFQPEKKPVDKTRPDDIIKSTDPLDNACFQYKDFASFVIRMKEPLTPILNVNDPLCSTSEVPNYLYQPEVFDYETTDKYLSSVPGMWPGDQNQFPLILFNSSNKLKKLVSEIKYSDIGKVENCLAVTSSFGYLNAVSTYLGFTQFQPLTYPLVTQTIVTNGQDWNFYVYQLNTTSFHKDIDEKNCRNICWMSEKLRLFDCIEDGQVKGINVDVYRVLLKFLLNAPVVEEGLELRPYLGEDTRDKDDIENLRYFLRRMNSWAPEIHDHKLEVPMWEQIYKDHPEAPPSPYIKRSNAKWSQ